MREGDGGFPPISMPASNRMWRHAHNTWCSSRGLILIFDFGLFDFNQSFRTAAEPLIDVVIGVGGFPPISLPVATAVSRIRGAFFLVRRCFKRAPAILIFINQLLNGIARLSLPIILPADG